MMRFIRAVPVLSMRALRERSHRVTRTSEGPLRDIIGATSVLYGQVEGLEGRRITPGKDSAVQGPDPAVRTTPG